MGLPLLLCPVNPANPIWLIFAATFQPLLAQLLPSCVYNRLKVAIYGWEFRCRYTINAKLGPAFVLVTPSSNEVWIADPDMANEVLGRRQDFVQLEMASRWFPLRLQPSYRAPLLQRPLLAMDTENPVGSTGIMAMFGPNISSSNGAEWQRHRRLVAPTLNERIMDTVWSNSSAQAGEMMRELPFQVTNQNCGPSSKSGTTRTIDGLRTIAINIVASIGYSSRRSWAEAVGETEPPAGHYLTFMQALLAIANNHIISVFIPARLLTSSPMPKGLQILGHASEEFPLYAKQMIANERRTPSSSKSLLGSLVKIAGEGKGTRDFLSDDEIVGNLFNFTLAGFDTTASTMAYAIVILAISPEWQDWIGEEIDRVAVKHPQADYDGTFPLLTRCLALMYEILRLFTPVLHIARCTTSPQILRSHGIPANTNVFVAPSLIHVSPTLYGPDALSFRPTRWVIQNGQGCEALATPPSGTFLPWSSGPRHCPGTKMAQVEFVSVIRTIFERWRVEVAVEKGESLDEARKRLRRTVEASQPKITLQIRNPEEVALRWVRKRGRTG
ncbi:MAG: hypothetical protein Q9207_002202 [Kuettlingeria erythrocarpa]